MQPVSVAMATYNGARHIGRQLDSLAKQSGRPVELVVTDDCSTDDTVAIVEAFAKTSPFPVRIFRNEMRLGYRANFMRAASLCQSDLIAFCDQDDVWYAKKLASAAEPFEDPSVVLSYHNADVVAEDGQWLASLDDRSAPSGPWFYALGFTLVFRRSLMQLYELWPQSQDSMEPGEPAAHDLWIFFLAKVFGKVVHLEEPLAAHVQHETNTYGVKSLPARQWLKYVFRYRGPEIANFAKVAENRADILNAAVNLDAAWRPRAIENVVYYKRLTDLWIDRTRLYTSRSLFDRMIAFSALLRKSGYAEKWGLGAKALFLDTLIGVPLGPRLQQ